MGRSASLASGGRRRRAGGRTGLFSGRGRRWRALLDLPIWRRRGCCHWIASLVPAWGVRMTGPRYAELQVTSHFSFLRGASSCEELFAQAALLGIEALAIADRTSVLVYPTDRPAYARLCRLLSLGKRRSGKAKCHLEWSDLAAKMSEL